MNLFQPQSCVFDTVKIFNTTHIQYNFAGSSKIAIFFLSNHFDLV